MNGAYNTLKDPLSRAHYLLGLQGLDPSGDEVSQLGDSEEEMELLTTVMEAQEELDELPDMSLVVAGIREEQKEKAIGIVIKVLLRNAGRIQEAERILAEAFAHSDLASARKEAVRLKYWLNIQRKAWEWDERSGNREVRKKIEEMKQVKAENEHRNQKGSVMADTATSTMLNHLLSS